MFDREYHVASKPCRVNDRLQSSGLKSRSIHHFGADPGPKAALLPVFQRFSPLLELSASEDDASGQSSTLQTRLYLTLFARGSETLVRLRLIEPRRRDAVFSGNLGPEGVGWAAAFLIAGLECIAGQAWSTAALSFGISALGLGAIRAFLAYHSWQVFQAEKQAQNNALLNAVHRQLAPMEKSGVARY